MIKTYKLEGKVFLYICYDLGLLDNDMNYASKEVSKFNKVFQNLFEVYLTKYGSTNIHDMMQNTGASGSTPHLNNETIWLYNTWRNEIFK